LYIYSVSSLFFITLVESIARIPGGVCEQIATEKRIAW
jgi:hypothetical protein